jgi:hypothetical protein
MRFNKKSRPEKGQKASRCWMYFGPNTPGYGVRCWIDRNDPLGYRTAPVEDIGCAGGGAKVPMYFQLKGTYVVQFTQA